jgi:hypothetical protein
VKAFFTNWRTVPNSRETALMKTRVSRRKGARGEYIVSALG